MAGTQGLVTGCMYNSRRGAQVQEYRYRNTGEERGTGTGTGEGYRYCCTQHSASYWLGDARFWAGTQGVLTGTTAPSTQSAAGSAVAVLRVHAPWRMGPRASAMVWARPSRQQPSCSYAACTWTVCMCVNTGDPWLLACACSGTLCCRLLTCACSGT